MLDPKLIIESTDAEIVALSLTDRQYFSVVVERYENKLARYVRRLGVFSHEDRQDILQEIFIKVYRNLNAFDRSLSFSSWIYRITHNETISWYRKQQVRPEGHLITEADDLFAYIPDHQPSTEVLIDEAIDAQVLHEAIAHLETKYRDPIILRFFEYKEYEEISDILKIPIGTVGTLIARGKKKLQSNLSEQRLSNGIAP